jgi:hypothetical protein
VKDTCNSNFKNRILVTYKPFGKIQSKKG